MGSNQSQDDWNILLKRVEVHEAADDVLLAGTVGLIFTEEEGKEIILFSKEGSLEGVWKK